MNIHNYDIIYRNIARNTIRQLDSIHLPSSPVIVFDIDSTLIDDNGNAIKPITCIYHYALLLGIKIAIITARVGTPEIIDITKKQLKNIGITDINYLYFRRAYDTNPESFKLNSRRDLHMKSHQVIMSIGDQDWDVYGEHTGISVKLPYT